MISKTGLKFIDLVLIVKKIKQKERKKIKFIHLMTLGL